MSGRALTNNGHEQGRVAMPSSSNGARDWSGMSTGDCLIFCLFSCVDSNDFDPNTIPVNVLDVENHQMLKLLQDNPGVLLDITRVLISQFFQ